MRTFYLIRKGWNSANQSSVGRPANPRTNFDSGLYKLVAIVQAESAEAAKAQFTGSVYNNQFLFAETNPRAIAGLTAAIREFQEPAYC